MFLSRDGKQRCVTSLLQVCVCALSAPSGELCLQCGCQGEVNEHNLDCEQDDCQITTQLLQCAACNIAFHEECMAVLHLGLSRVRVALPWCSECYDEWFDDERHSSNLQSKGEVTINYSLSTRDKTPTPSGMPLVKTPACRKQTRHTRDLQRQLTAKPFRPCFKGEKCPNNCGLVSAIARQTIRDEYMRIRSGITKGARYRAGCFALSFIKREYAFPSNTHKLIGHPDSL